MTLSASYFDQLYADSADPWSLQTRWYEARKYAATLASLRRAHYRRGFEPGCSVGVLTEQLAGRCDQLLACDVVPAAVAATLQRLRDRPHVEVRQLRAPDEWPTGSFDLVVISELGYYLTGADLDRLVARAAGSLTPDADLVLVHWRHPVPDYPLCGDDVRAAFLGYPGLEPVVRHEEADFRLDVLTPAPAVSVATAEGLV
jgi:predicted TPR repeat methyltransferase